ncbi:uncharacterized protein G2W53_041235 [Senna tora]|uniref:Uncharacterized protein n=1 Tax=Senna tora TaxID=362788 RepID=A0A834SRM3_9FABA|nr:uncharacterized protein G2W53_041235 [Senna tora]
MESSWHGRSVDHVLTYSRREIMVKAQKRSRKYVKTRSTLLPWDDDYNSIIKSTRFRKYKANRSVSLTCATRLLTLTLSMFLRFDRNFSTRIC